MLSNIGNAQTRVEPDVAIDGEVPLVHIWVLEVGGVGRSEVGCAVVGGRDAAAAGVRIGPCEHRVSVRTDVVKRAHIGAGGARQRVEGRAQDRGPEGSKAAANYGIGIGEGAIGKAQAGSEVVLVVLLQSLRQTRGFGGLKGSARYAVDPGSRPGQIGCAGAGVYREFQTWCEQRGCLCAGGVNYGTGSRNRAVEVADVACLIGEGRLPIPAHAKFQRQLLAHSETVLNIGVVLTRTAIVVHLHVAVRSVRRHAVQEVRELVLAERASEIEVAEVVGADEAEAGLGAQPAHVHSKLDLVSANRPGCVVVGLVSAIGIAVLHAPNFHAGQIVEGNIWQAVEWSIRQSVEAKRLLKCLAVVAEVAVRALVGIAKAEFVQYVRRNGVVVRRDQRTVVACVAGGWQKQIVRTQLILVFQAETGEDRLLGSQIVIPANIELLRVNVGSLVRYEVVVVRDIEIAVVSGRPECRHQFIRNRAKVCGGNDTAGIRFARRGIQQHARFVGEIALFHRLGRDPVLSNASSRIHQLFVVGVEERPVLAVVDFREQDRTAGRETEVVYLLFRL